MRFNALRQATIARLLAAFETPYYSRIWAGSCLNSTGRWISRLCLGWLALSLTNSPLWVGLVAGLEGVGQLGFGVLSGVLVDRLDRRLALMVIYVSNAAVMLAVGLLVLTGRIVPWHLLIIALLQGALVSIQVPATNVIVYQLAGRERLMNAAAAQMLSFNTARVAGSALAGVIIAARGVGPAYLAGAVAAAGGVFMILSIQGSFRSSAPQSTFWAAAAEGFKYVWTNLSLRRLLYLSAFVETFGFSHYTLVPVIARDVLKVGAPGLGALSTAAASAGLLLMLFALSPWYPWTLLAAVLLGGALVAYDALMQTLTQLLTSDAVRGRVLGVFGLTYGFNSVGGFVAGAVAAAAGAPVAIPRAAA